VDEPHRVALEVETRLGDEFADAVEGSRLSQAGALGVFP